MSVEIAEPSAPVTVTAAAAAHFKTQLKGRSAHGIRISVKESGCTGYMYEMDVLENEPEATDLAIDIGDGARIFIDPKALPFMQGTVIDFVSEGLNNVLRFDNPRAQDYCGCGESFSIQDDLG